MPGDSSVKPSGLWFSNLKRATLNVLSEGKI